MVEYLRIACMTLSCVTKLARTGTNACVCHTEKAQNKVQPICAVSSTSDLIFAPCICNESSVTLARNVPMSGQEMSTKKHACLDYSRAIGPSDLRLCEKRSTQLLGSTTNFQAGTKGWFKRLQVLVSSKINSWTVRVWLKRDIWLWFHMGSVLEPNKNAQRMFWL